MLGSSKICAVVLAVSALAAIRSARAYTIETQFTAKCHEKLTAEALRRARATLEIPATRPATGDERALIDDLQFAPDDDMKDLAGATLLAGVRDNDLKGNSQDDLTVLSAIHGDPHSQQEHCLRGPDQKEPGGSALAIAACRSFVQGRVLEALDGLATTGLPDLDKRTSLPLYLSFRGRVDASLPLYYVRIGQAMHAIQDSFTHTYRTADGMKITVVLNWLDSVNGALVESADGPAHATKLDVCDDPDDLRKTRRVLATDASAALLVATMGPRKTRGERIAAVDGVLDTYLAYSPGCTFANGWCQAAEAGYKDQKNFFGCTTVPGAAMAGWSSLVLLAGMMGCRRNRRQRYALRAGGLLIAIAASAAARADGAKDSAPPMEPTASSTTTTTPAKAATSTAVAIPATITITTTTTTSAEPNTHAPPAPTIIAVEEPGPRDPSQRAWGAYLGSSGSIDKAAVAVQLGARLKLSKQWTVGLDGEWNPWITLNGYRFGSGVVNLYGTGILRFPLAYENFNLRATVNLGASYLLMNLYGAPSGSLGIFAGVSPAGVEWKLSRALILVVNPLSIAFPVPQMRGVPLTYPQYRFNVGFEIQKG
ncbi:MAG: hypothetical protein ACJ78U_12675 [Myxococcales bacterium]